MEKNAVKSQEVFFSSSKITKTAHLPGPGFEFAMHGQKAVRWLLK